VFGIINTQTNTVELITLGSPPTTWWDTVQVVGTKIYCIPYLNARGNQFGIIDTETNTLTLTTLGADPQKSYTWNSSASVGTKIYCIPQISSTGGTGGGNQFGIIDTETNTLTLTTLGADPAISYGWGASAVVDKKIYCIPTLNIFNGGNQFGIIDTETDTLTLTTLGANPQDDYRWWSAVVVQPPT
jgi:hypothetical protein